MSAFYIEALENTAIRLNEVGYPDFGDIRYSINDPTSITEYYTTGDSVELSAGDKCYWTMDSTYARFSENDYLQFTSSGKINIGGELSSLTGNVDKVPAAYYFYSLFKNCTYLISASDLQMHTVLNEYCYMSMFEGCTSLVTIPNLPASNLPTSCYAYMFGGCSRISLSTSRTSSHQFAYRIPSTGGGSDPTRTALISMFAGTGSSFATPSIGRTYYLSRDYEATFCITALEPTTITLSKVGTPVIGEAFYALNSPLLDKYTLGTEISLTEGQYCLFFVERTQNDAFSNSNYLHFTSTGNFSVNGDLSDLIGGMNAVSSDYCFQSLFDGCTTLVSAQNLKLIENLNSKQYCYAGMFSGCTSLTAPPELPATTLTNYCYLSMFYGCTSLTTAPELPATSFTDN